MMETSYDLKTVLKLKSVHCVDSVVVHKLERSDIKSVSRLSFYHARKPSRPRISNVFGVPLDDQEQSKEPFVIEEYTVYLPKFFVKVVSFLNNHVTCEGIFRKAGSISRQKALRTTLNTGHPLPLSTSPYDVAALLKQYLRELPEPLLSRRLYPIYSEIIRNNHLTVSQKEELVLLTCLLLPEEHLLCLKVLMQLLNTVANCSHTHSLMNSESLSLVISPNLMSTVCNNGKKETLCFDLKTITDITRVLIDRADDIGKLSCDVFNSDNDKLKSSEHTPLKTPSGHTPWRGYMSGKIRGTWSRIRGRRQRQQKNDDECSIDKKLTLDDSIQNTPSVSGTARRLRKRKSRGSILDLRPKRSPNPANVHYNAHVKSSSNECSSSISTKQLKENKSCFDKHKPQTAVMIPKKQTMPEPRYKPSEVTIGQRVHLRRQKEHENISQSSSSNCIGSLSVKKHKLSTSQSDTRLYNSKVMTPFNSFKSKAGMTPIGKGKRAIEEKRKGFIHEHGNNTYSSKRAKKSCRKNEDIVCHSRKIINDTKHTTKNKPHITNDCNDELETVFDKGANNPTSPDLLQTVISEIAQRFECTPKQLAPMMSNNDSYLFAIETADEGSSSGLNDYKYPSNRSGHVNSKNVLTDIVNTHSTPSPISLTTQTTTARKKMKSLSRVQSSPFFSTSASKYRQPSVARTRKLSSRRARQYTPSTSHGPKTPNKPLNKPGLQVYEWIL